jgi:hypothetical protein
MTLRFAGLLLIAPTFVSAQRVVPVHQEPRHHLVLERPDLLVLDVQIAPGDTTLFHTHSTPIHYVTIGASATNSQVLGRDWPPTPGGGRQTVGTGFWTLEYATAPLTHRVANVGSSLFRLIAVTNLGKGSDARQAELPGQIEAESRWFRRSRLTLEPGAKVELMAVAPVLAVQVSAGMMGNRQYDQFGRGTKAVGEWVLLPPGDPHTLENPGTTAVTFVFVQIVK